MAYSTLNNKSSINLNDETIKMLLKICLKHHQSAASLHISSKWCISHGCHCWNPNWWHSSRFTMAI